MVSNGSALRFSLQLCLETSNYSDICSKKPCLDSTCTCCITIFEKLLDLRRTDRPRGFRRQNQFLDELSSTTLLLFESRDIHMPMPVHPTMSSEHKIPWRLFFILPSCRFGCASAHRELEIGWKAEAVRRQIGFPY